jgi:hypothetical protein
MIPKTLSKCRVSHILCTIRAVEMFASRDASQRSRHSSFTKPEEKSRTHTPACRQAGLTSPLLDARACSQRGLSKLFAWVSRIVSYPSPLVRWKEGGAEGSVPHPERLIVSKCREKEIPPSLQPAAYSDCVHAEKQHDAIRDYALERVEEEAVARLRFSSTETDR